MSLKDNVISLNKTNKKIEPPLLYKVILLNDDFTPMDFVIEILMKFFAKSLSVAEQIMFTVHFEGRAVCGIYSKDIALTKVEQVKNYAKEYGHPLACIAEEDN